MSSVVHTDAPYPKRLVGAEEALEQYGKIVPGLLPLLHNESLYQGIDHLKESQRAWEDRARALDESLNGAFEVLLWISEAPNREDGLSFHYESAAEAIDSIEGSGWVVEGNLVFCGSCIENEDYPSENTEAAVRSLVAKAKAAAVSGGGDQ